MIKNKIYKSALLALIILLASVTVQAQHVFLIRGQLSKDTQGIVVLHYYKHEKFKIDTARVVNGNFEFKGEIGDPSYAEICLNPPKQKELGDRQDAQGFYLEGTVTVKGAGNIITAKIAGARSQSDYLLFETMLKPLDTQMDELEKEGSRYKKAMNDTAVQRVSGQLNALKLKVRQADSSIVEKYPDSYVAFKLWSKAHRGVVDPGLESEFNHFSSQIRNTDAGKIMAKKIELAQKLNVGQPAPDFTLKDTSGRPVSLSALRGKNVLLCFWFRDFVFFNTFAFNMRRVDRLLHDRNFVMVGVYYNGIPHNSPSPERWKGAIRDNALNWLNVYDFGGLDADGAVSETAKNYGIDSSATLPILYLIGPDGKITARHLAWADRDIALKIEKLLK